MRQVGWVPSGPVLAGLLCGWLFAPGGIALGQPAGAEHTWAPGVLPVLESYLGGDYAEVQRAARVLQAEVADPAVQRDAAALGAMALLRTPVRTERVEGRAALAALLQEHPELASEPECQLAQGIGLTALRETSAALSALDAALGGFTARSATERRLATLVALAEAWAVHGEWETTPARFQIPRPADREAMLAVRLARIAALEREAREAATGAGAADRIELVAAELLLQAGMSEEGRRRLARLAEAAPLSRPGAEAALRLGELFEGADEWERALALYQRVRGAAWVDVARTAEDRVAAIQTPQLELEAPQVVRTADGPVAMRLRARGLDAVEVEVRQVGLTEWLGSPRTRGSETLLPEAGSLRYSQSIRTTVDRPYGWWNSTPEELPAAELEPGAYVVLARARVGTNGAAVVRKQLLLVSDLEAACLVGPQEAVVCARDTGEPCTVQFWMNRSFAAREWTLVDGELRFPLPNEARLMREKGWVCLVQSGRHAAVLRGHVPGPEQGAWGPRVAMMAGPPSVAPGDLLRVAGLLLSGSGEGAEPTGRTIEVHVRDVVEREVARLELPLDEAGCFSGTVPVTPAMVGKSLRVLAFQRGQPLFNEAGRVRSEVLDPAAERFVVRVDAAAGATGFAGVAELRYPWGSPAGFKRVRLTYEAVQLPRPGEPGVALPGVVLRDEFLTRSTGTASFELPLERVGLAPPLAVRLAAMARTPDQRAGRADSNWLIGATGAQAWMWTDPAAPAVGEPVAYRVGWFAANGLVLADWPELKISGPGGEAALAMQADVVGARSALWFPTAAGEYRAEIELTPLGGPPLRIEHALVVAPPPVERAAITRCAAFLSEAEKAVHILLTGAPSDALLVAVHDSEPRAARIVPAGSHAHELVLPVGVTDGSRLRVLVAALGPEGLRVLCGAPVAPDPATGSPVEVELPEGEFWPGATAPVRIRTVSAAGGAALLARLADASLPGLEPRFDPLLTGALEEAERLQGPAIASTAGNLGDWAQPDACVPGLAPRDPLQEILRPGGTLWAAAEEVKRDAMLHVEIPSRPGVYALDVVVRTMSGQLARRRVLLDARRGVRAELDVPARLAVGDRVLAALHLVNGFTTPRLVNVRFDVDAGVRLEAPRVVGGELVDRGDNGLRLRLPPDTDVWVHTDLQGVQAGSASLAAAIDDEGMQAGATAVCDVYPVETNTGESTVTRELSVWVPKLVQGEAELARPMTGHEGPDWGWVPLTAEMGVRPGQWVRVREEVQLRSQVQALRWEQRVPANCQPVREDVVTVKSVGPRESEGAGVLVYRAGDQGPGRLTHEYVLLAALPGSCAFEAPRLLSAGQALSVRVEPVGRIDVINP